MNQGQLIRALYNKMKQDAQGDTETILDFLNWLHYEKNEVVYLKDMDGLTEIERNYIEQLLEGKIAKKNFG